MVRIRYDSTLLAQFPSTRGGILIARGVRNGPTPGALLEAFQDEQRTALLRLEGLGFGDIPSLAAWRKVYRGFGAEPTQYRCAAEALVRRLKKQGSIPSVNLLVDLGNMVSIRYAMPLAVFDVRDLTGTLTIRLAGGNERFTELGSDAIKHPEPGEAIFVDDTGLVFARRWCWRQSQQSAARDDTSDIVLTLEGHHSTAEAEIRAGLADVRELLRQYAGATVTAADVLMPGHPELAG